MWKDSWEIIAAQPLPWLNKAPAVEQEVGSSTALRRQESSSLRTPVVWGRKVQTDTETTKSSESRQCVEMCKYKPPERRRPISENGKYVGKDVLLIDEELFACLINPAGFHKAAAE